MEKHDARKNHKMVMYIHKRWNGQARRVYPRTEDNNIEWIHVRMDSTPPLNVFGAYLDRGTKVDEAKSFWEEMRNNIKVIC